MRVNKIKVRIEVPILQNKLYPFELTDDIHPWNVPYVCMQIQDTFNIYSLLTGWHIVNL